MIMSGISAFTYHHEIEKNLFGHGTAMILLHSYPITVLLLLRRQPMIFSLDVMRNNI